MRARGLHKLHARKDLAFPGHDVFFADPSTTAVAGCAERVRRYAVVGRTRDRRGQSEQAHARVFVVQHARVERCRQRRAQLRCFARSQRRAADAAAVGIHTADRRRFATANPYRRHSEHRRHVGQHCALRWHAVRYKNRGACRRHRGSRTCSCRTRSTADGGRYVVHIARSAHYDARLRRTSRPSRRRRSLRRDSSTRAAPISR